MTFTDATLKSIKRKDGKNNFNPEITTHCDLSIFTDYESCILISPSVIILHSNGLAHMPYPLRSSYRHNKGWDWIAPCGTTTIASSLEKIKNGNATRSEASGETFVGGLSHGEKMASMYSRSTADFKPTWLAQKNSAKKCRCLERSQILLFLR